MNNEWQKYINDETGTIIEIKPYNDILYFIKSELTSEILGCNCLITRKDILKSYNILHEFDHDEYLKSIKKLLINLVIFQPNNLMDFNYYKLIKDYTYIINDDMTLTEVIMNKYKNYYDIKIDYISNGQEYFGLFEVHF